MLFIYNQIKKFFKRRVEEQNQRIETEKERDAKIKIALDAVNKYPEYRKQSIEIQKKLENQILELEDMHKATIARLSKMEEDIKRRERNKIRDRLVQNYRYYTNIETNPSQSWTKMESEAFWELFREYEEAGGNGYMHTEVLPVMERLTVVESNEE